MFKGAWERGIYDNMKTAVETVFVGKNRLYNRRFLQMLPGRAGRLYTGIGLGFILTPSLTGPTSGKQACVPFGPGILLGPLCRGVGLYVHVMPMHGSAYWSESEPSWGRYPQIFQRPP
jgi:hypothetical protein